MAIKKLYSDTEIRAAIYYDVIELMGEEGVNAKLTAYDLLAVMAAPCTRIDYDNTAKTKRTPLLIAVNSFMSRNQKIKSLTYTQLVAELNRSFIPTIPVEKQKEMITSYKMVIGFDADGYAVFDNKYYEVYKKNMDNGNYEKIKYGALSSSYNTKSDLPDKEITKTYHVIKTSGRYELSLDMTTNDWIEILRGTSDKTMQMIGAFSKMNNLTASHSEIEERFGIIKETINGITRGLGNRAKRIMGIEVLYPDGKPCYWILPFNNGRDDADRGFLWELRPEVYKAYMYLTEKKVS